MLRNVTGKPQAECLFEQEQQGNNGYLIERLDYIGRHVISIKRPQRDNFYWTIGVKDNGQGRTVQEAAVLGYYSMGTNGSLKDVTEALESTKHLFPTPAIAPQVAATAAPKPIRPSIS